MIQSISLNKRLKCLMSLVLAALTIVAIFPPIKSQAVSNDYYYFLTGFDGSSMNVSCVARSTDYDILSSFDSYVYRNSPDPYNYELSYDEFLNFCNASGITSILTILDRRGMGSGATASGTFSLNSDTSSFHYFDICNYHSSYSLEINLDNSNLVYIDDYDHDYPRFSLPAGNYEVDFDGYDVDFYTREGSDITGGNPFVRQMYQQIKDKANEIGLAAQGLNADGSVNATKTVYYNAPAVNAEIIKALMNSNGVSLVVTYNFAGYEFTSTITSEKAKEMYNAEITWYGPAYIAKYCGATWTGKTV